VSAATVQRVVLRHRVEAAGTARSVARWLDHGDDPQLVAPSAALHRVWSRVVDLSVGPVHLLGADLGSPAEQSDDEVPDDEVPLGFFDHLSAAPPSPDPVRVQRCGVYAVVVADERVLLTRLAGRGRWTLPGGGIDVGEHPGDALAREVDEETGLHLLGADPVELRTSHWTGRAPNGRLEDFHAVRFLYRGQVSGGDPMVREVGGTSDQAAWFALTDLVTLDLTPMVAALVTDWPDLRS
jgi:ADP-ribose pyrophosphatase YjhB (NUDIX family)